MAIPLLFAAIMIDSMANNQQTTQPNKIPNKIPNKKKYVPKVSNKINNLEDSVKTEHIKKKSFSLKNCFCCS